MFTFLSKDRLEYVASKLWAKVKNTFALKSHTHEKSHITDFPTSMPANGGNADTVNGFTVGVNVPADAEFHYELPSADVETLGGIKLGFVQADKKYPVSVSGQNAYVEVPWVDTTYDVSDSSADGLMSSQDKIKLDGIESGANKIIINDTLTSTSATEALSAAQGKYLNDKLTELQNKLLLIESGSEPVLVEYDEE